MKIIKSLILYLSIASAFSVTSCAIPIAVKSLSTEQLKVQQEFLGTLKKHFLVIDNFVESQIRTTEMMIDIQTKELEMKFMKKTLNFLEREDKSKNGEILNELIKNIREAYKSDEDTKKGLLSILYKLREKHKEMLNSYAVIVQAQKKLDEYIQMEKADEVFVNQLIALVGIEQGKLSQTFDDIGSIFQDIQKITNKEERR